MVTELSISHWDELVAVCFCRNISDADCIVYSKLSINKSSGCKPCEKFENRVIKKNCHQQTYCCKRDWTLKHQLCATISSSSGSTNKTQQKFLISSTKQSPAVVPGRQLWNIPPAAIPEHWTIKESHFVGKIYSLFTNNFKWRKIIFDSQLWHGSLASIHQ